MLDGSRIPTYSLWHHFSQPLSRAFESSADQISIFGWTRPWNLSLSTKVSRTWHKTLAAESGSATFKSIPVGWPAVGDSEFIYSARDSLIVQKLNTTISQVTAKRPPMAAAGVLFHAVSKLRTNVGWMYFVPCLLLHDYLMCVPEEGTSAGARSRDSRDSTRR